MYYDYLSNKTPYIIEHIPKPPVETKEVVVNKSKIPSRVLGGTTKEVNKGVGQQKLNKEERHENKKKKMNHVDQRNSSYVEQTLLTSPPTIPASARTQFVFKFSSGIDLTLVDWALLLVGASVIFPMGAYVTTSSIIACHKLMITN